MTSTPSKYNNVQVALHWVTALLILFMLFMGQFALERTPNTDPAKIFALRGHMVFGLAVLLLTSIRIAWRRFSAQPPHAATGKPALDKAGVAAHYALNILALLTALSGIGIAIQAGLPEIVFGGQGVLPPDFWGYGSRAAHGILTKLLLLLVAVHVLGGLYHEFMLKDRLFRRIWFGKSRG